MANPFLGQIEPVGFNFAPRGWATCSGQLLPIAQNTALFSLLGTAFGGDGRTTFALPDLRGRVAKNVGTGPGLQTVAWGQRGGAEDYTMTNAHMPSHNHTLRAQFNLGSRANSNGSWLASDASADFTWWNAADGGTSNPVNTNDGSILNTGGSQAMDIRNPYLGVYFNIALQGIFPSRS